MGFGSPLALEALSSNTVFWKPWLNGGFWPPTKVNKVMWVPSGASREAAKSRTSPELMVSERVIPWMTNASGTKMVEETVLLGGMEIAVVLGYVKPWVVPNEGV